MKDASRPKFYATIKYNETKDSWAERFYLALAETRRVFRTESYGLMYVDPVTGPDFLANDVAFYGPANSIIEPFRTVEREGEKNDQACFLRVEEVRTLFAHPQKAILPILRSVVREPAVVRVPGKRGEYKVIEPGYNEDSKLFYWVPPGHAGLRPREGTRHLFECFRGVPFAAPAHRAALTAWLLGGICMDPEVNPPLLVVDGNQQGVGKTSTVQAVGKILTGDDVSPVAFRGDEFGKQVSAKFVAQERVIFLDNIVVPQGRSFDSPVLSQFLTQGLSKKVRILGQSKEASASGLLFAASLNEAKLSTDLADRSLHVRLQREVNCPMDPYCKDYARDHREQIYGELLGLALQPFPGHSCQKWPTFRFRGWLDFVHPRIPAGVFGELDLSDARAMDDIVQELFSFGFETVEKGCFTAREFYASVTRAEASYPALCAKLMSIASEKNRVISAGRLLRIHCNATHAVNPEVTLKLICTKDGGKDPAEYKFEIV